MHDDYIRKEVDQLARVIKLIMHNPDDPRIIMSVWKLFGEVNHSLIGEFFALPTRLRCTEMTQQMMTKPLQILINYSWQLRFQCLIVLDLIM